MSTIGYENWAVDLADVGAVYPFQGLEVPMVILGVLFWLGWHRMQFLAENKELETEKNNHDSSEAKAAVERY